MLVSIQQQCRPQKELKNLYKTILNFLCGQIAAKVV